MKKLLIIFLFTFLALSGKEKDSLVIHLNPYEEVLAGVILLEDISGITEERSMELYKELLEFSNISHEEFKSFLNDNRTDPEKWFKIMERISSATK